MREIEQVLKEHPNLSAFGFGVGNPISPEEVKICIDWLSSRSIDLVRKTINTKCSSYTWKHIVERSTKKYISNGAFICAALHLGFKMKRIDKISPNAWFNMRKTEE